MIQAKSRENATSEVTNDPESQIYAIRGGGRPLAESKFLVLSQVLHWQQ